MSHKRTHAQWILGRRRGLKFTYSFTPSLGYLCLIATLLLPLGIPLQYSCIAVHQSLLCEGSLRAF